MKKLPVLAHPESCPRCCSKDFEAYNINEQGMITDCDKCPDKHDWPLPTGDCRLCGATIESVAKNGNICKGRIN